MGADIHGFIECRTWTPGLDVGETAWCAAISLKMLVGRDYEAFDCLFGVRSSGHWRPVAADRGLPQDASETTKAGLAEWGEAAFGVTWLNWDEVTAIDWDEPALHPTNVAQYRQLPDQRLELVHRSVWSRRFARASGVDTLTVDPHQVAVLWDEGTEWKDRDTVFRVERATRRRAVPPGSAGPAMSTSKSDQCFRWGRSSGWRTKGGRRPVGSIRGLKRGEGHRVRFQRHGEMRTYPEVFATRAEAERALWRMIDTGQADCKHDRRYRAFVLLARFASLRWGEITALTRSDLDLDAGTVGVRLAYVNA
ncbi:hypothetical protein ACFKCF_54920, partial [Nonomuraea sp. JJY05]